MFEVCYSILKWEKVNDKRTIVAFWLTLLHEALLTSYICVTLRFSGEDHVEMHVTKAWAAITLNPSERCLRNEKGKRIFKTPNNNCFITHTGTFFWFHLHVSLNLVQAFIACYRWMFFDNVTECSTCYALFKQL